MRVRVIKDVRTREIERKIFIAAIRSKIIASTTIRENSYLSQLNRWSRLEKVIIYLATSLQVIDLRERERWRVIETG